MDFSFDILVAVNIETSYTPYYKTKGTHVLVKGFSLKGSSIRFTRDMYPARMSIRGVTVKADQAYPPRFC